MARMKNLTVVEEEMFKFLRYSSKVNSKKLKLELEKFLHKIKHLEKNPFESRSVAYLDIISCVESKVYDISMEEVVYTKYKKSLHKKMSLVTQ